jgi:hypothetical protein
MRDLIQLSWCCLESGVATMIEVGQLQLRCSCEAGMRTNKRKSRGGLSKRGVE